MKSILQKVLLILFFGLLLFISFNKHSKDRQKSYHDVIWADAAGYYVYNTMWFVYGNNAASFPDSIDVKTGNGFRLDLQTDKVYTKYPCGTALLEAPFFLAAHLLAKPLGFEANGFSKIYSYGLYISAVFYCFAAMLLLISFLKWHFSSVISVASVILFFVSTNLYYYTIDASGMSHVYSFFVFSCIIYLTPVLVAKLTSKKLFLFMLLTVIAVLIRPTNLFIVLFPIFYGMDKLIDIVPHIAFFFQSKKATFRLFLFSLIITIPQMLYWKSISGNFISYGYKDEGFDFWKSPKLLEVWFSANNGLFIYTPIILLSLIGVFVMIKNRDYLGYYIGILFLIISYVFASWWNWWFGCSFGARSFVEYYALLIIPFCFLWKSIVNKPVYKILFFTFIALCCFINLSIEYYYDGCFYGSTWDYGAFVKLITT